MPPVTEEHFISNEETDRALDSLMRVRLDLITAEVILIGRA